MSRYTTELRNILTTDFDLGMETYPIFNEVYRDTLNKKIFDHYYFHEIGFETVARFKHYLNTTMNEIMPYYNKLYQSELLTINPLLSFERKIDRTKDIGSTTVKTVDNTANSTGDSTATTNQDVNQNTSLNSTKNFNTNNVIKDKDIFSDTPKSLLEDSDVETNYFATDARIKTNTAIIDEDEVLTTTEGTIKSDDTVTTTHLENETTINEDAKETLTLNETNVITENGFEIPLADLLIKYRETFLNIDLLIIGQLKDLFLMIY